MGRFTPDHFDASQNTAQLATATGAGGFTYIGQSFDYVSGNNPAVTVTARNAQDTTTQNYTGSWFKITTGSLTNRAYASASGMLAVSAPNAPRISDVGVPASCGLTLQPKIAISVKHTERNSRRNLRG